jgi:Putative addiction module component
VPSDADGVLGEALKLAPDERARIVAELLATLEPDLPGEKRSEAEWIQELERRARAGIAPQSRIILGRGAHPDRGPTLRRLNVR